MNFNRSHASLSFTPYHEPKSQQIEEEDFQIQEFSRLTLNSHENRSVRSNSSLINPILPNYYQKKPSDSLSLRSRNRKNSSQQVWKNSIAANMSFLNKSIAGKSSLYRHQQFNLHEIQEPLYLQKSLSEKSCPVGIEETSNFHGIDKCKKPSEEGESLEHIGGQRQKFVKKFLKTKNLLRNIGSYLHKYIKHNKKCKPLIILYYKKKFGEKSQEQGQEFYKQFIEWVSGVNLVNFQDYQKIWTESNQFKSIYRQICYKYYREELFSDVYFSRLTEKKLIQEHIPLFIAGLLSPKQFTHF